MTSIEQKKMIQRLKSVSNKMNYSERSLFDMMAKRDKDDEDLDKLTSEKLINLFDKYFPKKSKEDLLNKWKKSFEKT